MRKDKVPKGVRSRWADRRLRTFPEAAGILYSHKMVA
jgi:hypothetical protein